MLHVLSLLARPGTEKPQRVSLGERRDRTQQEGEKEGVTKIKGEIELRY